MATPIGVATGSNLLQQLTPLVQHEFHVIIQLVLDGFHPTSALKTEYITQTVHRIDLTFLGKIHFHKQNMIRLKFGCKRPSMKKVIAFLQYYFFLFFSILPCFLSYLTNKFL